MNLLTINSIPFKHNLHPFNNLIRDSIYVFYVYKLIRAKSAGDVFSYPMVIANFFFFSARMKASEGNYLCK